MHDPPSCCSFVILPLLFLNPRHTPALHHSGKKPPTVLSAAFVLPCIPKLLNVRRVTKLEKKKIYKNGSFVGADITLLCQLYTTWADSSPVTAGIKSQWSRLEARGIEQKMICSVKLLVFTQLGEIKTDGMCRHKLYISVCEVLHNQKQKCCAATVTGRNEWKR